MKLTDSQLKMLLLGSNLVEYEKLALAEKEAKIKKLSLLDVIPKMGLVSPDQLGRIVADALKYNFANISKEKIDREVLKIIPESVARARGVVPFARSTTGIKVGMLDPGDIEMIHFIEKKSGEKVIPFYVIREDLENILAKYDRGSIEVEVRDLIKSFDDKSLYGSLKDEALLRIFSNVIIFGYQYKTSDIHFEPFEEKVVVRFRIDGVLHDMVDMSKGLYNLILSRMKILAKIRTDEHRKAQDGKFKFDVGTEKIDIRVSVLPTTDGEKTVLRLLSSRRTQFGLTDVGFSEENIDKVLRGINNPHGMILVTGPTGSGKTTTVYSVMKILNKREVNIASIEDPVEYGIEGVNQIQADEKSGLTFAKGLRAILRQDPDIIMIGEIRDEETASIAVNSALTGHLVLSTLHTNNAATTLPRLLDMNIESFLVASTVNIAIAQRLVRQVCTKCRVSYKITEEELKIIENDVNIKMLLNKEGYSNFANMRLYKGQGCEACGNTGFIGRIGIFEVLEMTEELRSLVVDRVSSDKLQEAAKKEGMSTMLHDGILKVFKGVTTLMEVFRVTRE